MKTTVLKRSLFVAAPFLLLTATLLCSSCNTPTSRPGYYLTDDGFSSYFDESRKELVIRADQGRIEDAKLRPECRPAEKDPEGNWGSAMNGFQVGLRLPANQFKAGDRIPVEMFVRNISDQQLRYEVLVPDKNHKIEMLRDGKRLPSKEESDRDFSFRGRVRSLIKDVYHKRLFPRTQHRHEFELLEFYDLSEPGAYAVRMGRVVPGSDSKTVRECMSGWAQFEVTHK